MRVSIKPGRMQFTRIRRLTTALHPADQKPVGEVIEHSRQTGDPIDVECRVEDCRAEGGAGSDHGKHEEELRRQADE